MAEAACTGLEDGPALETFFRKWETESKWQNTCLAKLMIFSFLDIRTTDLEQSLQRTRQSAEERLNGPYLLRDINSGGISFYAAEPGQTIPPLAEQLDGLMIEEQYRWRLYKLLTNYSAMFDELSALLRPAAQRVQDILPRILPQLQPVYDHWEPILFLSSLFGAAGALYEPEHAAGRNGHLYQPQPRGGRRHDLYL